MSAPKKNQKTEVAMTERQRQEAKEAKSVKVMTFTFVTAIILCLAIFVVSVASAPVMSVITRNTDAATVGDHTLSAVELNYFYIDAISSYYSNYSSYISYILDVTKPLDKQTANSEIRIKIASSRVQSPSCAILASQTRTGAFLIRSAPSSARSTAS